MHLPRRRSGSSALRRDGKSARAARARAARVGAREQGRCARPRGRGARRRVCSVQAAAARRPPAGKTGGRRPQLGRAAAAPPRVAVQLFSCSRMHLHVPRSSRGLRAGWARAHAPAVSAPSSPKVARRPKVENPLRPYEGT